MTESEKILHDTFEKGSKTYFNSSFFLPKKLKHDVFRLYAFVRTVDDFVDQIPPDSDGFYKFISQYRTALASNTASGNIIVDEYVNLTREKNLDLSLIEAFFHSMELDLKKSKYTTMDEVLDYIYGSAEVIGLIFVQLLGLSDKAHHGAKMLGRSMQMINFIRDVAEDSSFGRTYLPLESSGLQDLNESTALANKELFIKFIRKQISTFSQWETDASKSYAFIPYRTRIAIKTAADMYYWTARQIYKDPLIVFSKKVKPSKLRIFITLFTNAAILPFRR